MYGRKRAHAAFASRKGDVEANVQIGGFPLHLIAIFRTMHQLGAFPRGALFRRIFQAIRPKSSPQVLLVVIPTLLWTAKVTFQLLLAVLVHRQLSLTRTVFLDQMSIYAPRIGKGCSVLGSHESYEKMNLYCAFLLSVWAAQFVVKNRLNWSGTST